MKKSICLYFQVHQPARLRLYRFFDIGKDSHYYDDFANRTILRRVAQKCYLPMNALLLELIEAKFAEEGVAYPRTLFAHGEPSDQYDPEAGGAGEKSIFEEMMDDWGDFGGGDDSYDDEY